MNYKELIKKKRIGIFIICRVGSKRLPKKIKKKIFDLTLLEILIERLITTFDKKNIVICTDGEAKSFFEKIRKKYNVKIFYGPKFNIFKRIIDAAIKFNFNYFVRITGDNPFTDLDNIKKMISKLNKKNFDYIYTDGLFPGLRSEIFSIEAMKKCMSQAVDKNSSEYLTYFFLRKNYFNIKCVKEKKLKKERFLSLTIDTKADFENIKKNLKSKNDIFWNRKQFIKNLILKKKEIKIPIKIPMITKKYNVKFKSDDKKNKFIFLKEYFS